MGHSHRPEHHHGHPAFGPSLQVGGLVVRHLAVLVAQLFAHRGHDQAVAQLHGADAPRRQQMLVAHGPIMAHRPATGQNPVASWMVGVGLEADYDCYLALRWP